MALALGICWKFDIFIAQCLGGPFFYRTQRITDDTLGQLPPPSYPCS